MSETVFYAIGDVHGLDERLANLHALILDDIARTGVQAEIVHLGDYIDRGPDSRAVIDRIMRLQQSAPLKGVSVRAVMGNHERIMLDAIDDPSGLADDKWLRNGGVETLVSYDTRIEEPRWRGAVDPAHIAWLRALPFTVTDPVSGLVFVHAGIEPDVYPECGEDVRLWTRSRRFFETQTWPKRAQLQGVRVVHGHTPTDDDRPYADERRINVDTGAVYGGPLTCVVLARDEPERFLFA